MASSEKKKNHLPKDTASNEKKKKKKKIYILQDLHLQAKVLKQMHLDNGISSKAMGLLFFD